MFKKEKEIIRNNAGSEIFTLCVNMTVITMGTGKGTSLQQRQRTLLLRAMAAASASCLFGEFSMPPSAMKAMQRPRMDVYTCSRLLQEKGSGLEGFIIFRARESNPLYPQRRGLLWISHLILLWSETYFV